MVMNAATELPLVHARGLIKHFGDLVAVDGIDFDVQRGEAFGFLGPNGAGKSSTMRMIGCVSPPTAGTLCILDLDPVADGPQISGRLGVVPQAESDQCGVVGHGGLSQTTPNGAGGFHP